MKTTIPHNTLDDIMVSNSQIGKISTILTFNLFAINFVITMTLIICITAEVIAIAKAELKKRTTTNSRTHTVRAKHKCTLA